MRVEDSGTGQIWVLLLGTLLKLSEVRCVFCKRETGSRALRRGVLRGIGRCIACSAHSAELSRGFRGPVCYVNPLPSTVVKPSPPPMGWVQSVPGGKMLPESGANACSRQDVNRSAGEGPASYDHQRAPLLQK